MNKQTPAHILWVDLEMTGLNAAKDRILEVAAIITDWKFTELKTYEGGVRQDKDEVSALMNNEFYRLFPQNREQLIAQSLQSPSEAEVEEALLALVNTYFANDEPVLLAGNSIHMDRQFIRQWWPKLDQRLHYRMLDVSAWKVVMQGRYNVAFDKQETHRALDDIRESIAELTYYQRWFGQED